MSVVSFTSCVSGVLIDVAESISVWEKVVLSVLTTILKVCYQMIEHGPQSDGELNLQLS